MGTNIKRKRKPFFYFLIVIYCLVLLELLGRFYFVRKYKTSLLSPQDYIYTFYPQLLETEFGFAKNKTDSYRILMLGGSVMNKDFGDVHYQIGKQFSEKLGKFVEVYNLAERSHTSLDSYYKYKYLKDKKFDLVLFYHGINELRANNCPSEMYDNQYTHYSWYNELNILENSQTLDYLVLPTALHLWVSSAIDGLSGKEFVGSNQPKVEWLEYGGEIKTAKAFEQNLEKIIELAHEKNEPMVLMSFAYHVTENYNIGAFLDKQLDYSDNRYPIELWGNPENILKGLKVHNSIISKIRAKYPDIIYVDQQSLLSGETNLYSDVCHLTQQGCETFVNNIISGYTEALALEAE